MKKSLLLMALLGSMTVTPLYATEHWAKGVELNKETRLATGAYTSYKHNSTGGDDAALCWAASASNLIAWWQDRTEENGAIIIPEGTPRGYDVWEAVRTYWINKGGLPGLALEQWMHGVSKASQYELNTLSATGYEAQGFYNRIGGADFHNRYFQFYCNFDVEGALVTNYYISGRDGHDYAGASKYLADGFDNGMMFCFSTSAHAMTVYGVNYDESTGLVKDFYWTDNNNTNEGYPKNRLIFGTASEGSTTGTMRVYGADAGRTIWQLYGIRSTGIHFTDYDVHINDQERDAVFSHYCNLIVDGDQEFALKYDLRDANEEGSPVLPYIYTYEDVYGEDGRYSVEVANKQHVTTGDIKLRSGRLSLIACSEDRIALDGGGKTSGTITFEAKDGATRTLSVQHSDTIAKGINIAAADGNTLEVTEDHTAIFGTLSGTGDLDKTGKGAAEVTNAVTLQGEIRVKEGDFIFGGNVELTGNTQLTVSAGARVLGKDGGQPITLTIDSGEHVNDGEMTLTTTVTGGTLKGSGVFGKVTIAGGEMIVGNSPGHQEYTDALTLSSGKLVFCVSGFDAPSEGENVGWNSDAYSTINMRNHEFIVNPDGEVIIALGADAADTLTQSGDFSLQLVSGMTNTLTEDQLVALAAKTTFQLSDEIDSGAVGNAGLSQPAFSYQMVNQALVLKLASADNPTVPEPATGTLGLLALAALAARRRKK